MSVIFNPTNSGEVYSHENSLKESSKEQQALIRKYADELINPSDTLNNLNAWEFKGYLEKLSFDVLQSLYSCLKHLFTPEVFNEYRFTIAKCLLRVPSDQWSKLVKQINFIMPPGTHGHDVMWATEVLTSVSDLEERERLLTTAHYLFNYETLTVERGYILHGLLGKSTKELEQLERGSKEIRHQFIAQVVPASLKEGGKPAVIYDSILEKAIKV